MWRSTKRPKSGSVKPIPSKFFTASCLILALTVAILIPTLPHLLVKDRFLSEQSFVGIAVDIGDRNVDESLKSSLGSWRERGVGAVAMDVNETKSTEALARAMGFSILWRSDNLTPESYQSFSSHVNSGDGVLPSEKGAFGYPGYLYKVGNRLRERRGFASVMEFASNKGVEILRSQFLVDVVKTHALHLEETLVPSSNLWRHRLVRAVRERKVSLLLIRLSPAWTEKQKLDFLSEVKSDLVCSGFFVGKISSRKVPWPMWMLNFSARYLLASLLAALGPMVILIFVLNLIPQRPWLSYVAVGGLSLVTGLTVHSLSFHPDALVGLREFRGVKVALIAPFVIGFLTLIPFREIRGWGDQPVVVKHLGWGIFLFGVVGVVFLMRSGNFPLISVSDSERHLRDALENFLGVRPRFKEFLIGNPLLLWGLHRWKNRSSEFNVRLADALLLIGGLLAPISIINTFCHLHIPVVLGLLRTLHGLCLGALVFLSVRGGIRWFQRSPLL